ncbi:hypothetical protein NEAUS06_0944 [Nematocida ausubeli]|nr:hypothetical protein NEAUS06_0927 [Nematocida ausubeli]KAI5134135.1 hypothetical protein NEAUS06_0944 [Nematocida ausubeli]
MVKLFFMVSASILALSAVRAASVLENIQQSSPQSIASEDQDNGEYNVPMSSLAQFLSNLDMEASLSGNKNPQIPAQAGFSVGASGASGAGGVGGAGGNAWRTLPLFPGAKTPLMESTKTKIYLQRNDRSVDVYTNHHIVPLNIEAVETMEYIVLTLDLKVPSMMGIIAETNEVHGDLIVKLVTKKNLHIDGTCLSLLPASKLNISTILCSAEENSIGFKIQWSEIFRFYKDLSARMSLLSQTYQDPVHVLGDHPYKIQVFLYKNYNLPTIETEKNVKNYILQKETEYPGSIENIYTIDNVLKGQSGQVHRLINVKVHSTRCDSEFEKIRANMESIKNKYEYISLPNKILDHVLLNNIVHVFTSGSILNSILHNQFLNNENSLKLYANSKKKAYLRKGYRILNSAGLFVPKDLLTKKMYNLGIGEVIPADFLKKRNEITISSGSIRRISQTELLFSHMTKSAMSDVEGVKNITALNLLLMAVKTLVCQVTETPKSGVSEIDIVNITQVIEPAIRYAIKNNENHKVLSAALYYYIVQVMYVARKAKLNYSVLLGYLIYIDDQSQYLTTVQKYQLERMIITSPALGNNFKKVVLGCVCYEREYNETNSSISQICADRMVAWCTKDKSAYPNRVCLAGCACIGSLMSEHEGDEDILVCPFTGEAVIDKDGSINSRLANKSKGKNAMARKPLSRKAAGSGSISSGTKTVISVVAISSAIISMCSCAYYVFFV